MLTHLAQRLALAAALITSGTITAYAVDKLNFDSLPSVSKPAKGLPGVDLNAANRLNDAKDDCTESRYHSIIKPEFGKSGLGESGTVTECNYGNLSVRTFQKGNGNGQDKLFPTPAPLIDNGPPPGSGGYAPVTRW